MAHSSSDMRTPLARVRGLGSAKAGSEHFWLQRVTAVANVFLTAFLVFTVVRLAGADYATARAALTEPLTAILMLLLVLSGMYHMRLGMQVIIEDYVQSEGLKIVSLMLNTFFAIFIGLACVYAVMKLSFGA